MRELRQILDRARALRQRGERAVLATVVAARGKLQATPRPEPEPHPADDPVGDAFFDQDAEYE